MSARRGVYAAAVSPFGEDGRLDGGKLADYCQHLLSEGGCDGVAPTGTTGEGTSIATEDRLALPGIFAEAGIEPDRVIVGTGAPSAGDCLALTRAALGAGYPNVLVLPPYYYKAPSDEGVYAYYARLIEGTNDPDLRVYLYHFPQMSAVPLSVGSRAAPSGRVRAETIAGLKDSARATSSSRAAFIEATGGVDGGLRCLSLVGGDALGRAFGSARPGIISGSTNAFAARRPDRAGPPPRGRREMPRWTKVKAARTMAAGNYPAHGRDEADRGLAHRRRRLGRAWRRRSSPLTEDATRDPWRADLDALDAGA